MSRSNREEQKKELPECIVDPTTKVKYFRGKFLGKVST